MQKRHSYICLTAHLNLIEENNIRKRRYVIALHSIEEIQKTKEVCFDNIREIFESYNLSMNTVKRHVTFITDRGANLVSALKDYDRLNCYAHLINNIVSEMCNVPRVKEIVSKAKSLVKYFKKST